MDTKTALAAHAPKIINRVEVESCQLSYVNFCLNYITYKRGINLDIIRQCLMFCGNGGKSPVIRKKYPDFHNLCILPAMGSPVTSGYV